MIPFFATHIPRQLERLFPDILWRVPTERRTLFLTFDDGPTPSMTGRLLDLLARYDAPSTFFLTGRAARREGGLVRALHEAGHTLGNHTYSHPDAWRSSSRHVLQELDQTTALLEDLSGQRLRWMRPPFGRFTRTMRAWSQARGQRLTMWDVMPGDYLPTASTLQVTRHVLRTVRPGSIIVLHDNPKALAVTPAALRTLLPDLTSDGWRFAALTP